MAQKFQGIVVDARRRFSAGSRWETGSHDTVEAAREAAQRTADFIRVGRAGQSIVSDFRVSVCEWQGDDWED
jgi:hypothetical protein